MILLGQEIQANSLQVITSSTRVNSTKEFTELESNAILFPNLCENLRFCAQHLRIFPFELVADGTYETQSNLVFTASRYENGGVITCEAINSVMIDKDESSMKSTLTLEVQYPPIVTVSPMNITVNETTDILLYCSHEANPMELKSVKW
ncbi:hypothetical protein RUM44_003391 [Polyplax serrata]|uniref:Ig-like domain-containing protein n=1 Tax=Polyplax serrata TaxID=468196 RepID=A0ABR1AGF8_POLSC